MDTQHSNIRDLARRRRLLGSIFITLPVITLLCCMGWIATAQFYPHTPDFLTFCADFTRETLCDFQKCIDQFNTLLLLPLFFSGIWLVLRPLYKLSFFLCVLSVGSFTVFLTFALQPYGIMGLLSAACVFVAGFVELCAVARPDISSSIPDIQQVNRIPYFAAWLFILSPLLFSCAETVIFCMRPLQISVAGDPEPRVFAVCFFMKTLGFYIPLLFPVCYCGWRLLLAQKMSTVLWGTLIVSLIFLGVIVFLTLSLHVLLS